MNYRCFDKQRDDFHLYGGRGIYVCERWRKGVPNAFQNFLADMGKRPEGHTLDRIDNDGPYEPGNCRWATSAEQDSNKRTNRWIEFDGRRQTMSQWARELNIKRWVLADRLKRGWPIEKALTEPLRLYGKHAGIARGHVRALERGVGCD